VIAAPFVPRKTTNAVRNCRSATSSKTRARCSGSASPLAGYSADSNDAAYGFVLPPHGLFTTIDDPAVSSAPGAGTAIFSINLFGATTGAYWGT